MTRRAARVRCARGRRSPAAGSPEFTRRHALVEIRPFRNDDWADVCAIYDLAKPDEMRGIVAPDAIPPLAVDPQMIALFRASRVVVMEHEGDVVGFAGCRENFITWLFVRPDCRRRGAARALLRHLLAAAGGPVTLNVVTSNEAALALYRGMGFAIEREYPGNFRGHPCRITRLFHGGAS